MSITVQNVVRCTDLPSSTRDEPVKEIHFFTDWMDRMDWEYKHRYLTKKNVLTSLSDYEETEEALNVARTMFESNENKYNKVCTTIQMCFLDTDWLVYGYRVFVHDSTGSFEIKLGDENERTTRFIRPEHILFKMWKNGGFSK